MLGYLGRNQILSELRKRFWIINANSAVCKVITQCVVCRRNRPKVGEQKMIKGWFLIYPLWLTLALTFFRPIDIKKKDELHWNAMEYCPHIWLPEHLTLTLAFKPSDALSVEESKWNIWGLIMEQILRMWKDNWESPHSRSYSKSLLHCGVEWSFPQEHLTMEECGSGWLNPLNKYFSLF